MKTLFLIACLSVTVASSAFGYFWGYERGQRECFKRPAATVYAELTPSEAEAVVLVLRERLAGSDLDYNERLPFGTTMMQLDPELSARRDRMASQVRVLKDAVAAFQQAIFQGHSGKTAAPKPVPQTRQSPNQYAATSGAVSWLRWCSP